MRWIEALGAMGFGCVNACVRAWAMPLKFDVSAVDEALQGGIAEGWRPVGAMAEKCGHAVAWIDQGCVGLLFKSFE